MGSMTIKRPTAQTQKFGARVLEKRLANDWTQRNLGDKAGIDPGFVSRIEAGLVEPGLGTLSVLAKTFGITLSELLKGIE
jgi:transcriptional regulator with XRE-family HTH domain